VEHRVKVMENGFVYDGQRYASLSKVARVIAGTRWSGFLFFQAALAVASALNQAGHKTKRHEARNGEVREGRAWNKADLLRILRNPVYAGCMGCGGELYKSEHEGLIDRAVFDRVQALLDNHSGTTRPPVHNPAYLLRGILKCGLCGRALTAGSNRKNGREYRYYRCVSYSKGGKDACRATSIPAGPIEDFVVEKIREIARRGGLADDVKMELERKVRTHRAELTKERLTLARQVEAHASRIEELGQLAVEGVGVAQRLAVQHLTSEESALRDLRVRLAEVERLVAALAHVEEEYTFADRVLREFDAVWDAMIRENRNRLAHALVREVVYNDETGHIRVEMADVRDPVDSLERRRKTGGMQKDRPNSGQTPITMGEASASGTG
jgi:hypothetical protein